ncbi:hypothetical protein HMPREF2999_02640 [Rothia sp. HMSC066H02]|nr:hypothetical protein HMPREF3008_03130 [Rothia sp. HMSC065D09]OFP13053.1 hypothetical protein HMPREF2999_02640 [Rothia sp. HMSC066H02]
MEASSSIQVLNNPTHVITICKLFRSNRICCSAPKKDKRYAKSCPLQQHSTIDRSEVSHDKLPLKLVIYNTLNNVLRNILGQECCCTQEKMHFIFEKIYKK